MKNTISKFFHISTSVREKQPAEKIQRENFVCAQFLVVKAFGVSNIFLCPSLFQANKLPVFRLATIVGNHAGGGMSNTSIISGRIPLLKGRYLCLVSPARHKKTTKRSDRQDQQNHNVFHCGFRCCFQDIGPGNHGVNRIVQSLGLNRRSQIPLTNMGQVLASVQDIKNAVTPILNNANMTQQEKDRLSYQTRVAMQVRKKKKQVLVQDKLLVGWQLLPMEFVLQLLGQPSLPNWAKQFQTPMECDKLVSLHTTSSMCLHSHS